MKEEYISKITALLNQCNNVTVLDFVYQFLAKRVAKNN